MHLPEVPVEPIQRLSRHVDQRNDLPFFRGRVEVRRVHGDGLRAAKMPIGDSDRKKKRASRAPDPAAARGYAAALGRSGRQSAQRCETR